MNIGRGVVHQYLQGLSGLMAGRESMVGNSSSPSRDELQWVKVRIWCGSHFGRERGWGFAGYTVWNRFTTLGAFVNMLADSHVSLSKPIQRARYSRVRPYRWESTISSTSYSGLSSTITGGGGGWVWPGSGSVAAGSSNEPWKTGWIFMDAGRSSL